ncbi:MAG: hypothetical protein LW870_11650 [Pirellula sp.]|jgi:hypothetical protein|nr:hypothetical protein [Pirellula sp.]
MTQLQHDINRVLRSDSNWDEAARGPLHSPFSPHLIDFCHSLSEKLRSDPDVRHRAEIAALAFWLRKSSVVKFTNEVRLSPNGSILSPRGAVFHIVPSNIDTMFVYSWVLSLLCGNRNIVRLPSKMTETGESVLRHIGGLFQESQFRSIAQSNAFCQYDHSVETTNAISILVDTRLIWGGDRTINAVRRSPLSPTASEFVFADKISIAIISKDFWKTLDDSSKAELARKFTRDSFSFGQQACSSPRVLVWVGENHAEHDQRDFWGLVLQHVASMGQPLQEISAVDKLVALDLFATEIPIKVQPSSDHRLSRALFAVEDLKHVLQSEHHCGNGLFLETNAAAISDIFFALTRRVQTLSYAGFCVDELHRVFQSYVLTGIDRVVPIGSALEFSHSWDGQNLFDVLLRKIRMS